MNKLFFMLFLLAIASFTSADPIITTLHDPPNGTIITSIADYPVDFIASGINPDQPNQSKQLKNATLYTDYYGGWVGNITNTTNLKNTENYTFEDFVLSGDVSIVWNVYICPLQPGDECSFASENFTLTKSTTGITLFSVSTSNNLWFILTILLLGLFFLILGYFEKALVPKVIGLTLISMAGIILLGNGYTLTLPTSESINRTTCVENTTIGAFPNFNITNVTNNCAYTFNPENYTTHPHAEIHEIGLGILLLILSLVVLADIILKMLDERRIT